MASSSRALVKVCDTELLDSDSREMYRQKIARITLDSMVQFVGLLDAEGTVLEINQVALDAVGISLNDVEGKPFWTTFWWQVSDEINGELREAIRRAAQGEFVRWDTEIYGRAGGKETIVIDASLMPVRDELGKVVFIAAEGRDITEKKAYEREIARQREELAELDKLKTRFFANISHEFRTPLTLMMGPLEDAVADSEMLSAANRERLELAHRNSLRLLKLVNSLLDFSRIEAGRIHASYEPTDLATMTAQLASGFHSAMERAGLQLFIDCHPMSDMVYVDREMWEKIVLNLLSNAFKFTFEGKVSVEQREVDGGMELLVRDTGTGIPADEIPRLFERFHRVKGARGRSYEGSGIGLALVQELVRLHGGDIAVESEVDKGTTFRVRLPFGKLHLPAEQIGAARELASTAVRSDAFVQEALRWHTGDHFPNTSELLESHFFSATANNPQSVNSTAPELGGKVLVVDDNADMRDYMQSLLAHQYVVLTAADGQDGFNLAKSEHPSLILTDIMMPGMDGFALLRALRSDIATREIPVIFLSARAGEESTIEGRAAGADDYLIKPFSARELQARVGAHLKLAQARKDADALLRENEARFRALVTATSDVIYRMSPHWREMAQLHGKDFLADTTNASTTWLEKYIPPEDHADVMKSIREAVEAKNPFKLEHRVLRADGTLGWTLSRAIPMKDEHGNVVEWFGAASDVTAAKQAQESLRQSHAKLSEQARLLDLSNDAILVRDKDDRVIYWNRGATEIYGYTSEEAAGQVTHELLRTEFPEPLSRIKERLSCDGRWSGELIHTRKDGGKIFVGSRWALERDVHGKTVRILETNSDATQRKQAEDALRRSEKLAVLGRMAATISHEINNPLEALSNLLYLASTTEGLPSSARQRLADADAELQRVAHITRQSLGFYRESNAAGSVDVNTLIESVITLLRNRIETRHVHIEKQWRSAQEIKAVAGELRQVISNLLMNCLDAVDKGGTVKVRVGLCNLRDDRPGIRITFSDNGKGIEAAMRSRIFEPLYTTKGSVGTGLGLWVSKQIVEKHNGRIQMRSSTAGERRGSTFSILLPR